MSFEPIVLLYSVRSAITATADCACEHASKTLLMQNEDGGRRCDGYSDQRWISDMDSSSQLSLTLSTRKRRHYQLFSEVSNTTP